MWRKVNHRPLARDSADYSKQDMVRLGVWWVPHLRESVALRSPVKGTRPEAAISELFRSEALASCLQGSPYMYEGRDLSFAASNVGAIGARKRNFRCHPAPSAAAAAK